MKKNEHQLPKQTKKLLNQTTLLYLLAGGIALLAMSILLWFGYQSIKNNILPGSIVSVGNVATSTLGDPTCPFRKSINGECIETADQQATSVVAIMVENYIEAQPLSGIASASVVYESPVEGGIPRFLAVYDSSQVVEKVGPVRSARPYYLDWLAEYNNAMYMHVGGSPDALELINERNVFDMNEFYRGWYYYRSSDRFAPHNTYTSSELWQAAATRYTTTSTTEYNFSPWKFSSLSTCNENCVASIYIDYGGAYQLNWQFNSSTNQYERYQFGRRHRDQDGTPYIADTILVQETDAEVLDAVGRLDVETLGEGNGYVFRDGYKFNARWKKQSLSDRTRWYNDSGEEIALRPGRIWVEIVTYINPIRF